MSKICKNLYELVGLYIVDAQRPQTLRVLAIMHERAPTVHSRYHNSYHRSVCPSDSTPIQVASLEIHSWSYMGILGGTYLEDGLAIWIKLISPQTSCMLQPDKTPGSGHNSKLDASGL